MMVLADDRGSGVGDFTLLISVGCPSDGDHRGRWSSPRPPQAESGIVKLSPVVERTCVTERHDSGRSAVVSLLCDRSPAVLNHLEHRCIVPDLLGTLVSLLVPAGNHPHHSVVISGQPSVRGRSTSEHFMQPGVPPFVRRARRGRNPVHEFVDRSLAAGLLDLIQRRRTHEIRVPGGCFRRADKPPENRSRLSGSQKVGSVVSGRHPRAIPARHRRTGDDRGCQRRPRKMAQPGDLPKLADQRLFHNSTQRRLGVKRSRVQIPAARLNSAGQRPCRSASWRRCLAPFSG